MLMTASAQAAAGILMLQVIPLTITNMAEGENLYEELLPGRKRNGL
jgi:hypothetical protein